MFGEMPHLSGFVDSYGKHVSAEKSLLQMSRAVTYLKDSVSLDKWDHAQDPVFPSAQRNSGCDQIVRERELVIE